MTITHSVQQEFLDERKSLICIPCRTSASSLAVATADNVACPNSYAVASPATSSTSTRSSTKISTARKGKRWTEDEHARFLQGMEMFKAGPWKEIAGVVGTRDARQTMSHAQKYRQKIKRRKLAAVQTPASPQTTTKKRRTMTSSAAVEEAAGRVGTSASLVRKSAAAQLVREEVDGELSATGLIAAETVRPMNVEANVASRPSGVEIQPDAARDEVPPHSLDATLEPLEIDVDVSVIEPEEFWGFLHQPSRD